MVFTFVNSYRVGLRARQSWFQFQLGYDYVTLHLTSPRLNFLTSKKWEKMRAITSELL